MSGRAIDGLYLNTGCQSPRRGGSFYYTLSQVQQTEGTNNGEYNNHIFSRKSCGGSNCNGDFIRQFGGGDHDGARVIEPMRTQRLSLDRNGADVFSRTMSLQPNYVSPSKLRGPSRLPTLPFEAHSRSTRSFLQSSQPPEFVPKDISMDRPGTSSSFMSVSGARAPLSPMPARGSGLSPSLR